MTIPVYVSRAFSFLHAPKDGEIQYGLQYGRIQGPRKAPSLSLVLRQYLSLPLILALCLIRPIAAVSAPMTLTFNEFGTLNAVPVAAGPLDPNLIDPWDHILTALTTGTASQIIYDNLVFEGYLRGDLVAETHGV